MVGVEDAGSTQAGMVLEGNAAALRIEHRVRDVAKAVQRIAPVLTCFHTTTNYSACVLWCHACGPMLCDHLLKYNHRQRKAISTTLKNHKPDDVLCNMPLSTLRCLV